MTDIQIIEALLDDSRTMAQRTAIAHNILEMSEEEFEAFAAAELQDLQEGMQEQEREPLAC